MTRDVALHGLRQQCGDYSVRLVAVTGEEFSNEVDVVFNTCDNSTETREGDVTMDYPLEEEEEEEEGSCVAPVTECQRPEPRQARESSEARGRAGGPTAVSIILICAVLIFGKCL